MRCFVASDDPAAGARVRDLLLELGFACPASHVATVDEVWGHLDQISPGTPPDLEIVVAVLAADPDRVIKAVRNNRRRTAARILLVGSTTDAKLVLRALREGANEFLDQTDLKSELSAALNRLAVEAAPGRIIGLVSASGGCGCSTVAVNLAVALAKTQRSCALLDLQFEFGDLATMLDLKPAYSIADLCKNSLRLDASLLDGCLMAHSSGIHLLGASGSIADRKTVTEDCVNAVVALATRRFPFAVLDLGNLIRAERTRILQQADLLLMVFRLDFACLRNTRSALEYLTDAGISKDRVRVISNRGGLPDEITIAAAEDALGVKVFSNLPDDSKFVNRGNNNGIPVLLQSPTSRFSRAIVDLAEKVSKLTAVETT